MKTCLHKNLPGLLFIIYMITKKLTQATVPLEKHPVDDRNKESFTAVIKKRKTFCQN